MRSTPFINIGLAFGSILAFFLIIEFGLRITGLQTVTPNPPKIYQRSANSEISYELKPNLRNERAYKAKVSTDSLGFRLNYPNPTPNPNTTPNPIIAVLGDSITFGYGVHDDETLSAKIEEELNTYQLINAAVPGYQLTQEIAAYKEKILPLKPEGVILVFYWNDLDGFASGILDDDGVLREAGWKPSQKSCSPIEEGLMGWIPGKCWLDDHSAFYKAFKKSINLRQSKAARDLERQEAATSQESVKEEALVDYIRQLREFSRILPQKRYFVIWPDDLWHRETKPQLIDAALRSGFEVVDLYEVFGNAVPTLPWDTVHPSTEAIEKAAKHIATQ